MNYNIQPDHGYYTVRFRVKTDKGVMKNISRSTGIKVAKGNKRKAEERAKEIVAEWESKIFSADSFALFADYLKSYLNRHQSKVSPTTHSGYVHMSEKHIEPYFRDKGIRLKDVRPVHLEEYYSAKIAEGLSPNTISKHAALLYSVFKDAQKNGIIQVNPAELADKPDRKKFDPVFYTKEEALKLWQSIQGTTLEMPVYFALMFGLRRSEAVAVRWSAIDFENKLLWVKSKITLVHLDGKVHKVESNTMKSASSKSVYPLNDEQVRYLKEVKAKQDQYTRITEEYRDFVCVDEIGRLISPDFVTHKFGELLDALGLKHIRFHDLRHCCISILANDPRFTMKQTQAYARHANFNITADTYSHVDLGAKAAQLDALTELFMGTTDSSSEDDQ